MNIWLFLNCICHAILFLALDLKGCEGTLSANGANVCSRAQSYSQSYRQPYQISWKKRSTTGCGLWGWGRCTVYRTVYGTAYRTVTRQAYKSVYFCCPGWKQQGNVCPVAICKNSCVNGQCTQPDVCSCNAGYYGQRCDREKRAHDLFIANRPYGKIPTKEGPIRLFGFCLKLLPCHIINYPHYFMWPSNATPSTPTVPPEPGSEAPSSLCPVTPPPASPSPVPRASPVSPSPPAPQTVTRSGRAIRRLARYAD